MNLGKDAESDFSERDCSDESEMKMRAHSQSSVHTDFMPHYTKITSCVKTPQEREILRKGLDNLHAELMSAQASRTGAVAAAARAPKGCMGLPEDDNKHKGKRQKTPWSASKEKRHTKTRTTK